MLASIPDITIKRKKETSVQVNQKINVEAVKEQMLQADGVFKMLIEVQREYNSLMPLEMQEQDENWFDDIDEKMMSFKYKIHNWIRDAEHERKERLSSK